MADMTDFEIKTGNFHEAARGLILARGFSELEIICTFFGRSCFQYFSPKWMVEVLDVYEKVAAHFSVQGAPEIMNPDPFY